MPARMVRGGGNTQSADAGTTTPAPETPADDGDVYTVDMYLLTPAEVPQGLDRVLEEVNKITLAELNMKLNVVFLSFATGSQQIPLMLSSGEKFDINFGGSANAPNYVNSGYLTNLADLLPAVEDTLNASYGADEVEYASVNGYITAFRCTRIRYSSRPCSLRRIFWRSMALWMRRLPSLP